MRRPDRKPDPEASGVGHPIGCVAGHPRGNARLRGEIVAHQPS
jgi:hypothetical protein